MKTSAQFVVFLVVFSKTIWCGIPVPRDNCHWLTATNWETVLKCDGNEVAVAACSGGGGHGNKDCPGGTVHQLECCAMPDYYYSGCHEVGVSQWGAPTSCLDNSVDSLLEGSCSSGENRDCHGFSMLITCCEGHLKGERVGGSDQQNWLYTGHGIPLECGRNDEVILGRCSSGKYADCPGGTSHGILCGELIIL